MGTGLAYQLADDYLPRVAPDSAQQPDLDAQHGFYAIPGTRLGYGQTYLYLLSDPGNEWPLSFLANVSDEYGVVFTEIPEGAADQLSRLIWPAPPNTVAHDYAKARLNARLAGDKR